LDRPEPALDAIVHREIHQTLIRREGSGVKKVPAPRLCWFYSLQHHVEELERSPAERIAPTG